MKTLPFRLIASLATPALPLLALCTLGTAACGGSNNPDAGPDLTVPVDLRPAPDLSAPGPDLNGDDLAPPTVPLPPNCQAGNYTVANIYTDIVKPSCATSTSCHAPGAGTPYTISQASDITTAWVNHTATEAPSLNRITPNDVNKSYVMYKLTGTQAEVTAEGGARMPKGGAELSNAFLCEMVAWINSGAK